MNTMMLLPPKPGVCQECAIDHVPHYPHNAQSLYYQVKFKMEHGRDATWIDAMAHCDDQMKSIWREALARNGVDVDAGEISPRKAE